MLRRGVRSLFWVRDALLNQAASIARVGKGQPRCAHCQRLVERRKGGAGFFNGETWLCSKKCQA